MVARVPALLVSVGVIGTVLVVAAAAAGADLDPAALWHLRKAEAREAQLWIAAFATALLALDAALRGSRRPLPRRLRDSVLGLLVVATLVAWWHPHRFAFRAWLHTTDAFHYYVGAKYFDELQYARLYDCTLIADAAAGVPDLEGRYARNLVTNRIEPTDSLLANPVRCTRHFTAERWEDFTADVAWFRKRMHPFNWRRMRTDHGYNPPPTWTLVGRPIASAVPIGKPGMWAITSLDLGLLAATFGALAWGFGWPAAALGLIFWGTTPFANWDWYGGSFLRTDWLAASALGLACVRKGHPVAAGLALAWATSVRIFPAVIVAGLAAAALVGLWRRRSLWPTPAQRGFGLAFAGAVALIVAASSLSVGPQAWSSFVDNSRLHLETETVNRMGLHPMLGYRSETRLAATLQRGSPDPYVRWREERSRTNAARRPLFLGLALGFAGLLAFAVARVARSDADAEYGEPEAVAGLLGLGLAAVFLELGSYYYVVLILYAALLGRHPWVGVALMAMVTAGFGFGEWDDQSDGLVTRFSAVMLAFVLFTTAWVTWKPAGDGERRFVTE